LEVTLDGNTSIGGAETKHGRLVQRVQVDQRLDCPDFFSVSLHPSDDDPAKLASTFDDMTKAAKPGAPVEIAMGYGKKETVAKGEVSYVEPSYRAGKMSLTFSGYDFTHRLTRGTNSRTFGQGHEADQNPGGILSSVVGDSGARDGGSDGLSAQTKSADSKLEYIAQYNLNDYQFIQQVVGSFGGGWDAQSHKDAKALSLKPVEKGSPVLTIYRDRPPSDPHVDAQAVSADFRLSTVRQCSKVEVRGWDWFAKKPLKGEASESDLDKIGGSDTGIAQTKSAQGGRVLTIVDLPVRDNNEAKEIAKSILGKLSMDWMTADVVIEGRPKAVAGATVKMEDFGTQFSGEYIVEACQHVFIAGAAKPYRTYLKLSRNASPKP
jgi:phage protein D